MKQKCKITDRVGLYCEHDQENVVLFIEECTCCHEPWTSDYIIKFCPVCGFQPERSKREDLDCICNDLEYVHDRYETYIMEYDDKCGSIIKKLLQKSKMRCSEHCGNTVSHK